MREGMRNAAKLAAALGLITSALLISVAAEARITRIEITSVQSPTFEGASFGDTGQYEKLRGRAFGEVDPSDLTDRKIVDIEVAPRNSRGMVEYSVDFLVLRPIDPSKGNRRVFYELTNRGTILSRRVFDEAPSFNDPTTIADAGLGTLLRQGYTLLFSGWESTAPPGGGRYLLNVPIAKHPDGSPIVGPALEEFIIDNSTTLTGALTYPAATSTPHRRRCWCARTTTTRRWKFP